jgi:hypothetical protein
MQEDVQTDPKPIEPPTHVAISPPTLIDPPQQVLVKVVSVEPAAEGPRMRIKKPLTEAQLEALRKGREKLAEKRKTLTSIEETESAMKNEDDVVSAAEPDDYHSPYCAIM